MHALHRSTLACVTVAYAAVLSAQAPAPRQTEADAYTRYELLAPGSAKFRILYDVTATTPGAKYYFNPIRTGSVATDEHVSDRATGKPLAFDVVGAAVARAGGVRVSDSTQQYIRVTLARPIPADGGEARVFIDKTYEDAKSYYVDGDVIVFDRPLGIKRNTVVLPKNYELVSCNYPSQILQEADGRIAISFWNATPGEAPLVLRARPASNLAASSASTPQHLRSRFMERATQTREAVYVLRQPETHTYEYTQDYTVSERASFMEFVPQTVHATPVSARNLDTGEPVHLTVGKRAFDGPPTEMLMAELPRVPAGGSTRIRVTVAYTDNGGYRLDGDVLFLNLTMERPSNSVLLPEGWALTNSAMPATVTTMPDGRVRLEFVNPHPEKLDVVITAHRR